MSPMENLDWVSPLDEQRIRGEDSHATRARANRLRKFGHWGFAEVLDDEAEFRQMLEQKIAEARSVQRGVPAPAAEVVLVLPRHQARVLAAEAKEAIKMRPQYAALYQLSEEIYGQLG